jgi:predicted phosphodiesterase
MQQRREFIRNLGLLTLPIPRSQQSDTKKTTFGIISDLHHLQFEVDEVERLKGFMDAVLHQSPDFIVQCGDFYQVEGWPAIMPEWNRYPGPKYHVLGNHDMDKCDKKTIMGLWGMKSPYYSFDQGGFHFIVMDRNFLKQPDGRLVDYAHSNWGPVAAPGRSFTDHAQLEWLKKDLAEARNPSIVFMHQPVFLSDFFDEIGNAGEILAIFDEANFKGSSVAAVFMGHDHDDRYGERNGVHYFLLNSASYVYTAEQAWYYRDPLYAFITLDPAGKLVLQGRASTYRAASDAVKARFPTKISDRELSI